MNLLLNKMQQAVEFKEKLEIGDLILTNWGYYPIYAIVADIRVNAEIEELGEWWNIDLIFLFVPPVKRTITINTEQIAGREKWILDGLEHFLVPLNLRSVGRKKPFLRFTNLQPPEGVFGSLTWSFMRLRLRTR